MMGVFNCPEREKKWRSTTVIDYHSYGYNFLYLGLPWPIAQTTTTVNPYATAGFTAGATRLSRLESTSDTVLLVENSSIWAFPPFYNAPVGQAPSTTLVPGQWNAISPRHGDKINVVFCDGHAKGLNPGELVAGPPSLSIGRPLKDGKQRGTAPNNKLWDVVKSKYP
jgi:prepilin-type processing-associated H-X9-DG protein